MSSNYINPEAAVDIVPVIALVILVLVIVTIYKVALITEKLPDIALDFNTVIIFSVILGMTAIFIYSSVIVESVPISYSVEKYDGPNNVSIAIDKESTVSIPLRNAPPFPPRSTTINATIYHNMHTTTIQAVKLSSANSILSYSPNFRLVNKSNFTKDIQIEHYEIIANAAHNLQIKNTTATYMIKILYFVDTNTMPQEWSVHFDLSTNVEDMSIFSYFWIVLIGVMSSRLLSLVLDKAEGDDAKRTGGNASSTLPRGMLPQVHNEEPSFIKLTINDYIWIIFSFIIAILVFSSFGTKLQLTSNIVANISLAFGFGFGFDKVLEVAKRFQNIV
jgi:hypothetical protein